MDFSRWLNQQAPIPVQSDADRHVQELLDEDVLRDVQGGYEAMCCRCGEWRELYCGPEEIDIDYVHYCGGSPRCCP
ncbi:hypothetical protein [Paraburkholderia sp.]|uniref:hypothetical protein n=1 Tax=Paraburkholderia sp. TaxID=1926495 RepID=UPI002399D68D|nr:hypothetical protein [Paraburkholderia sp.]MDE1179461.1 hypothetical protein [Paraburkholderia sp.]